MTTILKTTQEALLGAVLSVKGIVERRQTARVLANVLMRKHGPNVTFTTSDMTIEIHAAAKMEPHEGDFAITLDVGKMVDVLRTLPAKQAVTLDANDGRVTLRSGRSRFTLQSLPAEDFPLMESPADQELPAIILPQKLLRRMMQQAAVAMAVKDLRYYLNGMLFVAEPGKLSLIATDGHRMAVVSDEQRGDAGRINGIVPRKTVLELMRLLQESDEPAELRFGRSHVDARFNGLRLASKLIEGQFPDYTRAMPKTGGSRLTIGRAALLGLFQRAAILTNDRIQGVRLHLGSGCLRVSSVNNEQEEAMDELEVDYSGEAFETGFNATYLIEPLAASTDEMVSLQLADSKSPALFTLGAAGGFRYVVSPMRL